MNVKAQLKDGIYIRTRLPILTARLQANYTGTGLNDSFSNVNCSCSISKNSFEHFHGTSHQVFPSYK